MKKVKAIPQGYMTVGELAKKMGITVRTLQYYDKRNVLVPSAESEGGRRLYTDKDMIKLYQIMSLKSLGFSLEDIKDRLISLDSPGEVANILAEQAAELHRKIEELSESLEQIQQLRREVLQMHTVDFKKYADIIVNLQMKNEYYWLIKHFDEQTLDYVRGRFDKESSLEFIDTLRGLYNEIIQLQKDKVPPDSDKSQTVAAKFWDMVMYFTEGDMTMLPRLIELGKVDSVDKECRQQEACVNTYIESALDVYFTKLGRNPFEEESI